MKDSTFAVSGLPDDFVSKDDAGLIAFINSLRVSVKAKVAAGQSQGLALTEIVDQVRDMVKVAENDTIQSKAFPSSAFPAISRQAIAWCVEAYRPVDLVPTPTLVPTL